MAAAAVSPISDSRAMPDSRFLAENLIPRPTSLFWELLHCSAVSTLAPRPRIPGERSTHCAAFRGWLCLKLDQQVAEIEHFLDGQEPLERDLLLGWLNSGGHAALISKEAAPAERALFLSDLEIVLELIR